MPDLSFRRFPGFSLRFEIGEVYDWEFDCFWTHFLSMWEVWFLFFSQMEPFIEITFWIRFMNRRFSLKMEMVVLGLETFFHSFKTLDPWFRGFPQYFPIFSYFGQNRWLIYVKKYWNQTNRTCMSIQLSPTIFSNFIFLAKLEG